MYPCAPSRPADAVPSDSGPTRSDQRVRLRDLAIVLPFVGLPTAILLDGSRVLADALAPLLGSVANAHLLLYLNLSAVVVVTVAGWGARGFRAPSGTWPFLVLLLSFLPALVLSSFGPYAISKVTQMLTLTPALVLGTLVVLDSPARRLALLWVLGTLGALVAVLTLAYPDPLFEMRDAVVLRGSTAIATARAIGYGVVALLCLGVLVRRVRLFALLAAAGLTIPLVLTGSRGPVVGLAAAAIALTASRGQGRRWRAAIPVVGLGAVLAAALTSSFLPAAVSVRFEVFFGGPLDPSSEARMLLSRIALDAVAAHPLGLGWGDFGAVVPGGLLAVVPGQEHIVYPHNLPLEVAAEGGGVAVVGLLLLGFAVVRTIRVRPSDPSVAASGSVLVYSFFNALFSADINGNMMVWVLCAAVLSAHPAPGRRRRTAKPPDTLPERLVPPRRPALSP